MRQPVSVRRSAGTMPSGGRVPILVVLGLGVGGMALLSGATASEPGRAQEAKPTPRWFHSAAVVDGRIYVIGGAGADNRPLASVEVYDPATGRWNSRASLPTPRAALGAAAVRGRIYAVGGTTNGVDKLAVVEAYDPATDTWTKRADMPTPRNALSAIAVDGKLYAIGGWGLDRPEGGRGSLDPTAEGHEFATVEVYDPETNAWAARKDMPTPRGCMTASALGGRIYAIGGAVRRRDADVFLSLVEVYDTATDRWARVSDMPTPRVSPSSIVLDGRIYVMGGVASQGRGSSPLERMGSRKPLSVVEVHDPATGRWTSGADLATARGWLSMSVVDGRLHVIGGRAPAPDGGILEVNGAFPGMEVYTPIR